MIENEFKRYICAFTGHRPQKLSISKNEVYKFLSEEIYKAHKDGYYIFMSGMADGVDMWAADIVLSYRASHSDVKLVCVLPYNKQVKKYSENERILAEADYVKIVSEKYTPDCFYKRNRWMVDNSSRIIAVCNDDKSGTAYTIEYAKRKGIEVIKFR